MERKLDMVFSFCIVTIGICLVICQARHVHRKMIDEDPGMIRHQEKILGLMCASGDMQACDMLAEDTGNNMSKGVGESLTDRLNKIKISWEMLNKETAKSLGDGTKAEEFLKNQDWIFVHLGKIIKYINDEKDNMEKIETENEGNYDGIESDGEGQGGVNVGTQGQGEVMGDESEVGIEEGNVQPGEEAAVQTQEVLTDEEETTPTSGESQTGSGGAVEEVERQLIRELLAVFIKQRRREFYEPS